MKTTYQILYQLHTYIRKFTTIKYVAIIGLLFLAVSNINATIYYSRQSGNWSSNTTWSLTSGGSSVGTGVYPGASDAVYIERGYIVTVDITNAACTSVNIGRDVTYGSGTTRTGFLAFSSSGSPALTISGNIQIGGSSNSSSNGTVTFQSGSSLTAGSLTLGNSTSNAAGTITMTNGGTLTLNGSITLGGSGTKTFTRGTGTLVMNATNTLPSSIFTSLNNLTINNGTTTIGATTTIYGNLAINNGATFSIPAYSLTVNGTTTVGNGVSGTLSFTSTTGTETFVGLVTVNSGAIWNNNINEAVTYQGGITNYGTFNSGTGIQTFDTNSQALTGDISMPNVTITGVTLTNNNTFTVNTALSGTGGLTQATNSTLNIGGTSGISTLTATASGNTVNYTNGIQTVNGVTYYNLTLSGTGAKTTTGASVNGIFSIEGTATTTGTVVTYGGTASLQYKGSSTQTTGNEFTSPFTPTGGVIINNSNGVILGSARTISTGKLILTNGILTTSAANLLSITNTATTAISGGSSTSYISGPVKWTLPASLSSGSTYVFPIGKTSYLPFSFVNPTTGTGTTTAQLEAFNANSGGSADATTLDSISVSDYWQFTLSGNLTGSSVSLSRTSAITPLNAIAGSTSKTGTYYSIYGTPSTNGVSNSNSIGTYRYFTLAKAKPLITVSTSSLTGFSYPVGYGPSPVQNFTVSGVALSENITLTAPTDYEISTSSNGIFYPSLPLTINAGGSVSATTIYARLKSGLSIGNYNSENIAASSLGATTKTVTCSGTVVTAPVVTLSTTSISGMSYTFGGSSTVQSFTVSGTNLVDTVKITPPSNFEISLSAGSGFQTTAINLNTTKSATLSTTTIYVRLKAGLGVATYTQDIVVSSTATTAQNVSCNGSVLPTATIMTNTSSLNGFVYRSGYGPSGEMSFNVTGSNLGSNNITVTSLSSTYIEISTTSGGTFSSSVTLNQSGGSVNQTVYVRLKSGLSAGNYGPYNISLSSSGAVTKNISCKGYVSSTSPKILASSTSLTGFGYQYSSDTNYSGVADGGPSSEQSFFVSGASLSGIISVTPPTDFEISTTSGSGFQSTPLTFSYSGSDNRVNPTKIYVRLKSGLTTGDYTENMTVTSSSATTINITCVGKVYASPLVSASGGGTYCVGSTINLTSTGADIQNRYWEGPNSFYSTSQNPTLTNSTVNMSGDYVVTGNVVVGGNLVYNSDFSLGRTGFGSSYTAVDSAANALWPEGYYTVVTNPRSVHGNFSACTDHTTGTGRQMVINGASVAGVVIWAQSVPVIPGADYQFTYWEQTVCLPSPSQLQLYVNGVAAGPIYTASSTTCNWTQFLYNASAGSNSVLNLELVNQNTIANGNDFALDDIEFRQVLYAKDTTTVTVSNNIPVSVTLTASNNPVYSNTPVTFTATPTNGGATPGYQWYVNDVLQSGASLSTYTYTPTDGDVVKVVLTSSLTCTINNPANASVTMVVNPRDNYWMGGIDIDWAKTGNWTANRVPNPGEDVVFATVANYGTAAVNDLYLDIDRTIGNLVNNSSKALVIPVTKALTINSLVTTNNDPNQIIIQSDSLHATGSLIFGNKDINSSVYATVSFFSKSSINHAGAINNIYKWQYFGIPVKSIVAHPTFDGSYLRRWVESGDAITNHWISLSDGDALSSFYGYEICQDSHTMYDVKGILENRDFNSGALTATSTALYPGQYVFANPYTAAINIKNLTFGSHTEATVYLYNTGTYQDWVDHNGQTTYDSLAYLPGQYTAIPKNIAGSGGVQTQIPSMQGFLVKVITADANATFSIPYSSVAIKNTSMQRIASVSNDDKTYIKIDLKTDHLADRMWLFRESTCSNSFDNGWDGPKLFNSNSSMPQLCAIGTDGYYQVNSSKDINNTDIGFIAGNETNYNLTIACKNIESIYPGAYLVDLLEKKTIELSDNDITNYSFISTNTSGKIQGRFRILTQYYEKNNTDENEAIQIISSSDLIIIQNKTKYTGKIFLYDMSGRNVITKSLDPESIKTITTNLSAGAYIVKVRTTETEVNKRIILY